MTHDSSSSSLHVFSSSPCLGLARLAVLGVALALPSSSGGFSQPSLLSLEEIRSAVPPGGDCTQRRHLRKELVVPRKDQPLALVTIHAADSCWTDRLVLWQRAGDRYRASGSLSIIEAAGEPSGLKLVVTRCKLEKIH